MEQYYELVNRETGEHFFWNMKEILEEINRDRSDDWKNYDETDFAEGLQMTDYSLIELLGEKIMDEEAYQTLKRIIRSYYHKQVANDSDIVLIEDWVDRMEGN